MLSRWTRINKLVQASRKHLLLGLATATAGTVVGFASDVAYGQLQLPPVYRDQIVQTQNAEERDAPLDLRITAMPDVEANFDVIHHRSQLILTNKKIARMAIADPSVIEVAPYSETEISVIGLSLGTTTMTLWFEDDSDPLIYLVNTIRDPALEDRRRVDYGKLERKLALLFPNSKVYIIPMSGKIIVKGQAHDSQEASRIMQIVQGEVVNREGGLYGAPNVSGGGGGTDGIGIENTGLNGIGSGFGNASGLVVDMLQIPGEFQIMLRARIAELNRSQLRSFGVDWNYVMANGRHAIGSSLIGGTPTLSGIFENGEISVLIDALANNNTVTILSEPALTVLSGRTASFLAGGEFAVPTIVGVGGAQGTSTSFRGFGTSLLVTPTVIDGDLIRLQIIPEFSSTNSGNAVNGIPGLNSRRLQTTVELREGQTIVLGGLLSRQRNTSNSRIPLLGSIPLVGNALFNSRRATEDETELLIMVTPELVRPMDPEEVPPVPGFYVTHPNDYELCKYGMIEGIPDQNNYQLAPYGNKSGVGYPVGFNHYNPAPSQPMYSPNPANGGGQTQQNYDLSLPVPAAPLAPSYGPMGSVKPRINATPTAYNSRPAYNQPSQIQPVSGQRMAPAQSRTQALPPRLYQQR